jgi:hypothetical protein
MQSANSKINVNKSVYIHTYVISHAEKRVLKKTIREKVAEKILESEKAKWQWSGENCVIRKGTFLGNSVYCCWGRRGKRQEVLWKMILFLPWGKQFLRCSLSPSGTLRVTLLKRMQCRGLSHIRIWVQLYVSCLLTALEIDSVRSSLQIFFNNWEILTSMHLIHFQIMKLSVVDYLLWCTLSAPNNATAVHDLLYNMINRV